jgi:hypothetical protein
MSKASLQRASKRAGKARERAVQKRQVSSNGNHVLLEKKVAALEEAIRMLAAAHQHNVELMKQGFGINDAHVTVLQMISHDIVAGNVHMTPMVPDEIEYYIDLHEQKLPLRDWYLWLEERNCKPLRMRGQSLDLEWYHEQYNMVSRFLAFILWVKKVTGIEESNVQAHQG